MRDREKGKREREITFLNAENRVRKWTNWWGQEGKGTEGELLEIKGRWTCWRRWGSGTGSRQPGKLELTENSLSLGTGSLGKACLAAKSLVSGLRPPKVDSQIPTYCLSNPGQNTNLSLGFLTCKFVVGGTCFIKSLNTEISRAKVLKPVSFCIVGWCQTVRPRGA
jgi:hypothetical protein